MAITIDESLDQITLSSYTSNTFFYVGTGGLLTPTTAPTNGQILIGSTGSAPVIANITGSGGVTVTNGAGTINISNAGVTSAVAGTGISVSGATGAVTISNTGVISIAGTTNQITASASTGAVTLSLPSAVTTGSLTLTGLTANSFLYSGTSGLLTTTAAPTNGQLLIGSTGNAPVAATLTAGTAIGITNSTGSITINNSGVTSLTGSGGISVNASTGAITISNNTITCGNITAAGASQGAATLLSYAQNIINAGTGGVIFPSPTYVGQSINVENRSGAAVLLYPNSGAQIESLGTNASFSLADGGCFDFVALSTTQWYHTTNVLVAGTGMSITNSTAGDTAVKTFSNTGVTSITGTANQITASASTSVVTLSLPNIVITGGYYANNSFSASTTQGLFSTSTALSFSDTEVFMSGVDSVNNYIQSCMQNTNSGNAASADYIVNNNLSTASTYYGDFGINSSTYAGSGSFNLPNATYVQSQNGDLTLGTGSSNAIHFVINNGSTDAVAISTTGVTSFGASGGTNGVIALNGSTSGTITIQPQATAGTYNFNLPTTAGSAGQVLTSQGGGSTAMTWTTPASSGVTSFSAGTTGFTPSSATTGAITLAGTLAIANGGTGQTTAALARGPNGLDIDQRTTFSNANYTCLATDRYVAQIGTLTASVTITLPAASSVNAGQTLMIADESGSVTTTNYFTVSPSGTNNINGVNASKTFRTAYQRIEFISDGSTNWYYNIAGISTGGTGIGTIPTNGQLLIGNGSNYTLSTLTSGTGINITNGTGTITIANSGVTSFSAGTTGLTPNTATTGAVTLAGTLGVANGGTGTTTQFTQGSVIFAGASGVYSQDNTQFFWDDTNHRLGIGTASPSKSLDITGTGTARLGAILCAGSVPTIAFGTGAGTGATTLTTIGGTAGFFHSFTTGTSPAANATIITFTPAIAASSGYIVTFSATNAATAQAITRFYIASNATTITLSNTTTALAASTTYQFYYTIISV